MSANPVNVHVKICGITNLPDALAAMQAGADLLGFVFYARSPRYVEPACAAEIAAAVRERGRIEFAGVFVDESVERMQAIVRLAGLDYCQLHGNEPLETARALAPRVYPAIRPRGDAEAEHLVERWRPIVAGHAPALIVDAFDAKRFGGTGARADWRIATRIAQEFPILLAGGLNPGNVAEAIRSVRPWGVDVSSGVEKSPGIKDYDLVRQFIAEARSVS